MIRVRFTARVSLAIRRVLLAGAWMVEFGAWSAQPYEAAPEMIGGYLRNARTPIVIFNPQRDRMLIQTVERYPAIAGLATPSLSLAGLRFNPSTTVPYRVNHCRSLQLKRLDSERTIDIPLSKAIPISVPEWSPDGDQYAFMRSRGRDVVLCIGDGESGRFRHLLEVKLNGALGKPVQWLPDGRNLLCRILAEGAVKPANPSRVPLGPVVEDTAQPELQIARAGSFLQSERDEKLLEYFATSQLAIVNSETHQVTPIGKPRIFSRVQASPDGQYTFWCPTFVRPIRVICRYQVFPSGSRFGTVTETSFTIWRTFRRGEMFQLAACWRPNGCNWRPTSPAELIWADEPLDGGHPAILVPHRDRIMRLEAPFTGQPEEMVRVEDRLESLWWGEDPHVALLREYDAERGQFRTYLFNPDEFGATPEILWARRRGDRYTDPGKPVMRRLPNGQSVMRVYYNSIYLAGEGLLPKGCSRFWISSI